MVLCSVRAPPRLARTNVQVIVSLTSLFFVVLFIPVTLVVSRPSFTYVVISQSCFTVITCAPGLVVTAWVLRALVYPELRDKRLASFHRQQRSVQNTAVESPVPRPSENQLPRFPSTPMSFGRSEITLSTRASAQSITTGRTRTTRTVSLQTMMTDMVR